MFKHVLKMFKNLVIVACLIDGIGFLASFELDHTQGRSGGHNISLNGPLSKLGDVTQILKPVLFQPAFQTLKIQRFQEVTLFLSKSRFFYHYDAKVNRL